MRQFFKFFLAASLAGITLFFLTLIILIGIGSASSVSETYSAPANSVLYLDLNENIPERLHDDFLDQFDITTGKSKKTPGLVEILNVIKRAADDPNIKGIYLRMGMNSNGSATLQAIRDELKAFRTKGKFIIAYGDVVSQKSYYLSSVADKIYLHPSGVIQWNGLGTQLFYFKKMFDRLGVQVQAFHVGQYKSAIEPFVREQMSDANREQMRYLLGNLWTQMKDNLSTDRKLDTAALQLLADSLLIENAPLAQQYGFTDGVMFEDQVKDEIKKRLGLKPADKIEEVEVAKYMNQPQTNQTEPKVAVVFAEGEIVDGKGKRDIAGETYAKLIRELAEDKEIKAIVLRVNSPGGSALASDIIWREVIQARKKKPVVASFGDVAASGGYYISCATDRIFVQPNTITGSIGVFGLIPNLSKTFDEQLGITFDEVETSEHAVLGGVTKPVDPLESVVIQRGVERVYTDFTQKVSEGRKLPLSDVESVAQGRVWTGAQAIDRKLADELGGLEKAVAYAAGKARLKKWQLETYPREKNTFEKIVESLEESESAKIEAALGDQVKILKLLQKINRMQGIQARLPYFSAGSW